MDAHSQWLAQRSDHELALLAESNRIRAGLANRISYKTFAATLQHKRTAVSHDRFDAVASQVVAACAAYVARSVEPLVSRVKVLEQRIAELEGK